MPDRVAKRQATCQTWEEWRAASTTGRAPDRTRIPLRGEGLSDEWMQVAVVAGWLVTWWRHCPNQTRTSIRMHPCPTIRVSYFPTHRSPCRPRRSNRHLTIPAVTPAVCQSPPDSKPGPIDWRILRAAAQRSLCAGTLRVTIPVWDGPGNRVNGGGSTHLQVRR